MWHPTMNRLHDQTGIAHYVAPDAEPAGPACGTKVYTLGGGFQDPKDAGCHPCSRCAAIVKKRQQEGKPL